MILDLNKFIQQGQPVWSELETLLNRFDNDPDLKLDMNQVKRFHYLYQRSSSDLAKLVGFSARQEIKTYLESLVGRAYARIHETRKGKTKIALVSWLFFSFPMTFRKHITAFWVAFALILAGCVFGITAISLDKDAKPALMPFSNLMQNPKDRVAEAESAKKDTLAGKKSAFASQLVSNNTRVSFLTFSLGITWGVGTVLLLFSNGVFLGATVADYVLSGQTKFLIGWLLPHGSVEIPAILIAGQAGLILAGAVIGWGRPVTFKTRLRLISKDLFTLVGGVCVMLLWAGFVEAFFSQYHEPRISYNLKIIFGSIQLILVVIFFLLAGKHHK